MSRASHSVSQSIGHFSEYIAAHMKAHSLFEKLKQVSGALVIAAFFLNSADPAYAQKPNSFTPSPEGMARWANDERWSKWQEGFDKAYGAYKRKDYVLAEKLYLKALEQARAYGDNPSKVVELLSKFIVSMIDQGASLKAEPYYKELLTLATKLNRKSQLEEMAALCIEDLSTAYEESAAQPENLNTTYHKEMERRKFAFRHAIEIREKIFSANHPKILLAREGLANVCIADRDWTNALTQLELIRSKISGLSGKAWVHEVRHLIWLGLVYAKLGRKTESISTNSAVEKRLNSYGVRGEIEKYTGSFYRMCNEPKLAEPWFRKELAIVQKDGNQYEELLTYRNLAYCYVDQKMWAEAEKYYRKALALTDVAVKNDSHRKWEQLVDQLADTMRNQGKFKEAERMKKEAIAKLRVKNPLFKKPSQLYKEELDLFSDINQESQKKPLH